MFLPVSFRNRCSIVVVTICEITVTVGYSAYVGGGSDWRYNLCFTGCLVATYVMQW
jgi:hypothetical protein